MRLLLTFCTVLTAVRLAEQNTIEISVNLKRLWQPYTSSSSFSVLVPHQAVCIVLFSCDHCFYDCFILLTYHRCNSIEMKYYCCYFMLHVFYFFPLSFACLQVVDCFAVYSHFNITYSYSHCNSSVILIALKKWQLTHQQFDFLSQILQLPFYL